MPCLPAHPRSSTRAALLLLAALAGGVGCTSSSGDEDGTPLPEPPDGLPRPTWNAPAGPELATDAVAPAGLVMVLLGEHILVEPLAHVWAINLDQPSVAPAIVMARDDGRFVLPIFATKGDRIRILSRTETEHSPPLDVRVGIDMMRMPAEYVTLAPPFTISCLQVTPSETVEFEGSAGTVTLENRCAVPVQISDASLRLGDRGIVLGEVPDAIAPGEQASLTFTDSMGPGTSERLDILLLDVKTDGPTITYAIDLFTDLE